MSKSLEFFIKNVNRILEQKKWNRKILAERMGVDPPAISNSLGGTRHPRLDTIDAIADALNVPAWELLKDPNSPENLVKLSEALDLVRAAYHVLNKPLPGSIKPEKKVHKPKK